MNAPLSPIDQTKVAVTYETTGGSQLATALAKAQGELKNPTKDAANSHFNSKYATLAGALETSRPILSKHGLAVSQITKVVGEWLVLYTRLVHASGEYLEGEWPIAKLPITNPQAAGSANTYARKFSYFGIIGIAGTDDDDDGNAASAPRQQSAPPPPPPPPTPWRFDFPAYRKLLADCDTVDAVDAAYAKVIAKYGKQMTTADLEEADAILRESCGRFPINEDSEP